MKLNRKHLIANRILAILISLCLFLLIGCVSSNAHDSVNNQTFQLDPLFREFYENIGGEELLGQAISSTTAIDGKKAQYLEKAMIFFDPDRNDGKFVSFFPIGIELGITESGINHPKELRAGSLFINNHVVPPEFSKFYKHLGGQAIVGMPLTEVRYSPTYRRYEQYFENLGFYRLENEPGDAVHLLAYGDWFCSQDCNKIEDRNAIVDVQTPIAPLYLEVFDQLGVEFAGYLLEGPAQDLNGTQYDEAVFKNIVMKLNPNEGRVQFLEVPKLVGVKDGEMGQVESDPDMVFFPVLDNSTGFNVYKPIDEYIRSLGGYQITGKPINKYQQYGRFFRQCFEFVCLIYDPGADPWLRIYPEPLGYTYLRMYNRTVANSGEGVKALGRSELNASQPEYPLQIEVWEAYSSVSKDQAQIVFMRIQDQYRKPVSGLESSLTLTIPGRGEMIIKFPSTDPFGETSLQLPVFIAPNGTIIPYKACVNYLARSECREDSYAIWNNP